MAEALSEKQRHLVRVEERCADAQERLEEGVATEGDEALLAAKGALERELVADAEEAARKRSRAEAIRDALLSKSHLLPVAVVTAAAIVATGLVLGLVKGAEVGGKYIERAVGNVGVNLSFGQKKKKAEQAKAEQAKAAKS